MNNNIFTIRDIQNLVKPIAEKYGVKEIDVFEINENSDFYKAVMKERLLVA
ncbi:MAG: hypothetical protein HFG86_06445 [Dorea sp.]|jgi:hypothetical protein|nr:hypothetical protein [Dorea sp.]